MNAIKDKPAKRKTLTLRTKREPAETLPPNTKYVERPEAIYMVYGVGRDMPTRVYGTDEARLACRHASQLAHEHGRRFYVLRAWRGMDPAQEGE